MKIGCHYCSREPAAGGRGSVWIVKRLRAMIATKKTFIVAGELLLFVGFMFALVSCRSTVPSIVPPPQIDISFTFCAYTNDGDSACLLLTDDSGSISQYSGPYVVFWNGRKWEHYPPAFTALAEATKHMRKSENMIAPVPPAPARWRAYVDCVVFNQKVRGTVSVWTPMIQR